MTLVVEAQERCKKCFHFQVCSSVLKNELLICEAMLGEKEPKCKMFVEVVRCKDCKHWLHDFPGCTDAIGRCEWANYMVGCNGYCVYGERRNDDERTG